MLPPIHLNKKGNGIMKSKVITAFFAVSVMVSFTNADVVSNNGIAKDSVTGLMWQDDADTVNVRKDWEGAKQYCQDLRLGGYSDWQLPNIYEHTTLLNNTERRSQYIIDGFQNAGFLGYWSSTESVSLSGNAWSVYHGYSDYHGKSNWLFVRCVRAGQLSFDTLSLLKKEGKLKVSQKNMDKISKIPVAEKAQADIVSDYNETAKIKELQIIVNGNIKWDNEKNYKNTFENLTILNGLVWTTNHWNKNWYEGQKLCSNLTINSGGIIFNRFQLPSMSELSSLYTSGELRFGAYYEQYWSSEIPIGVHSDRDALVYDINRRAGDSTYKDSSLHVRCILSNDFFNNYSINDIANKLDYFNMKSVSDLVFPQKPEKNPYKELIKDEFETTEQFNYRIEEAKRIIDLENSNNLKNWNKLILNQKQEQKNKLIILENNKQNNYLQYLEVAMHIKYGNPKINEVTYNADKQVFDILLSSSRNNYSKKVEIPVKLQYAQKFKAILTDKTFTPTVEYRVINGELKFSAITEIKDPELLVEESEYNKAYNIKSNKDSISALYQFISKYPNSTFKASAESRIRELEEEIRLKKEKEDRDRIKREKEDRERQIRIEKNNERKQQSYYAKKYVGDKVCKDGTTAIILSITITAYVENVNGNNIQLRISDTEGTTPYMNGVTLYKNSLIWDDYSSWYKCNY